MSKTVMFVDDDDAFLMAVRRVCKKIDSVAEVLEATDGATALQLLEDLVGTGSEPPDVVFVDINMPVLDGFGFLRGFGELRARFPILSAVKPIAMLTSSDQERDKKAAFELGADEFLVKGSRLTELVEAIKKHV